MNEHAAPTPPAEVIARNLTALFRQHRRPDRRKFTNEDVAKYVTHVTGKTCNRTWIGKLRKAEVTAPDLRRLDAVAQFFGRTRADLLSIDDHEEIARLRAVAELAAQLKSKGVDIAQLAALDPADIGLFAHLVRRLINTDDSANESDRDPGAKPDPTGKCEMDSPVAGQALLLDDLSAPRPGGSRDARRRPAC